MDNDGDLSPIVDALVSAKREYERLRFDEQQHRGPRSAASQDQVAALERRLGWALPPSYRAFLLQHDGWPEFSGGASLLSVEDQDSAWVHERIAYWSDLLSPERDPFRRGALPVLLGEDENHFVVLEPKTVRADGEMDLVDYDYGEELQRFDNFLDFLRDDLDVMRGLIDRELRGVASDDEAAAG